VIHSVDGDSRARVAAHEDVMNSSSEIFSERPRHAANLAQVPVTSV
jgi:hypothetical protein